MNKISVIKIIFISMVGFWLANFVLNHIGLIFLLIYLILGINTFRILVKLEKEEFRVGDRFDVIFWFCAVFTIITPWMFIFEDDEFGQPYKTFYSFVKKHIQNQFNKLNIEIKWNWRGWPFMVSKKENSLEKISEKST